MLNRDELTQLAQRLMRGEVAMDDFVGLISNPTAHLGEVTLDLDRGRRCGYPEVVYSEGKSVDTLRKIFRRMTDDATRILATRMSPDKAVVLTAEFVGARYNELARTFRWEPSGERRENKLVENVEAGEEPAQSGAVAVVTAGTSDLPVAEEVRETLDWMGVPTDMIHDVGVAGPQRLLQQVARLRQAVAVVVVAGMEGALPSVVGGHVACPVIAVPTSVGYGAAFGGLAALLGMLNSCAANVAVVNIDAGFKAGYVAGMIAQRRC